MSDPGCPAFYQDLFSQTVTEGGSYAKGLVDRGWEGQRVPSPATRGSGKLCKLIEGSGVSENHHVTVIQRTASEADFHADE